LTVGLKGEQSHYERESRNINVSRMGDRKDPGDAPLAKLFTLVLCFASGTILFAPPSVQAGSIKPTLTFSEVSLGELKPRPFSAVINEVVRQSWDYRHVAFAAEQGDKVIVYVDGVPSKEYDDAWGVSFGPEGSQPVYAACQSNKWFVVSDGRAGKSYDRVGYNKEGYWPFIFSPDGKRLAYVAAESGKECIVVDGRAGSFYDKILPNTPGFSPNSKRLGYVARRGGRAVVVMDSRELAEGDEVMNRDWGAQTAGDWFSPNSKRIAFTIKRAGKSFVLVDGVESRAWDEVSSGFGYGFPEGDFNGVRFSPDSKHFVYEARRADNWSIVLDGSETVRGKYIGCLVFSPDSKRTAYVELLEGDKPDDWNTRVVVDKVAWKPFDGRVEKLLFSPDSKRPICVVGPRQEGKEFLVENGMAGEEYDQIDLFHGFPVFSPNGKHCAYVATRGEGTYLVLDGHESRLGKDCSVVSFTFSPDSKRWACFVETEGDDFVVVDGKRIGSYGIGKVAWDKQIVFSPDSRHIAFQAYHNSQCFLVVDGVEQEIKDLWLVDSSLVFDSPTHLHGLVMRGNQFLRLEVDIDNSARAKGK